ncbi:MAG: hypothetical protein ACOH2T_18960 [Pseudomonas sp.]
MTRMTNNAGLDLAIAVWLASDEYQYDDRPNYISVTTLIRGLKKTILGARVPEELRIPDISDRIATSIGHVLHRGVEYSWKLHYRSSMEKLGYPKGVIDSIRINPETEEPDTISVYTEFRTEREFKGWIISGQVDLIIEGRLTDAKSTKVWSFINQPSVEEWKLQGSIYRWLNPEKITHDQLAIQYLLLDWNRGAASRDPSYPPHAVPLRSYALMGLQETEQWVATKLSLLKQYWDSPEEQLPECSEEDLWRTQPVYKYYANPEKMGRSTKNFDGPMAELEAKNHLASKGHIGVVLQVPGEVKACNFCTAFPICKQKDRYIADGSLAPKK